LRAERIAGKIATNGSASAAAIPVVLARLYAAGSMDTVELAARKIVSAAAEGDTLRTQMAVLRRLAKHDPADTISLRRAVSAHLVKTGKYAI